MNVQRLYAHAMLSLLLLSSATSNAMSPWVPKDRREFALIGVTAAGMLGIFGISTLVNWIRNPGKIRKRGFKDKSMLKSLIHPGFLSKYQNQDGGISEEAVQRAVLHDALLQDAASKGSFAQAQLGNDANKLGKYTRKVNGEVNTFWVSNCIVQTLYHFRGQFSLLDKQHLVLSKANLGYSYHVQVDDC